MVQEANTTPETCLTLPGTIKKKKKVDRVSVKVNISRDELDILEANITSVQQKKCRICATNQGIHVLILSLFCTPFVMCLTSLYSFYIGTLTWYNIFNHVAEHDKIIKRVLFAPTLIFAYPFLIVCFSSGLAIYGALAQISWHYSSWLKQITDLEKGFYGWICSALSIEECCPYQVVVLVNVRNSGENPVQQTEL
ncbi:transmembrane protein 169 [Planococcus citri]|uniref:transmembrane protein 169 n=1 Tax=Planococcus citri TaxID=170843 RepID=UPI0031F989A8